MQTKELDTNLKEFYCTVKAVKNKDTEYANKFWSSMNIIAMQNITVHKK